jgi:hypothetical protein
MEVTHTLRSERGRLDAEKIRELFTLTRADLARITGVQEETIRQTPDSSDYLGAGCPRLSVQHFATLEDSYNGEVRPRGEGKAKKCLDEIGTEGCFWFDFVTPRCIFFPVLTHS